MALSRHRRSHLSPAIVAVRQEYIAAGARTVVAQLESLVRRAEAFLDDAEAAGMGQRPAAIRELRATIELLARITGELDERPVTTINVLTDASWLRVRGAVMAALEPYPEARLAVADGLRRLEAPA